MALVANQYWQEQAKEILFAYMDLKNSYYHTHQWHTRGASLPLAGGYFVTLTSDFIADVEIAALKYLSGKEYEVFKKLYRDGGMVDQANPPVSHVETLGAIHRKLGQAFDELGMYPYSKYIKKQYLRKEPVETVERKNTFLPEHLQLPVFGNPGPSMFCDGCSEPYLQRQSDSKKPWRYCGLACQEIDDPAPKEVDGDSNSG